MNKPASLLQEVSISSLNSRARKRSVNWTGFPSMDCSSQRSHVAQGEIRSLRPFGDPSSSLQITLFSLNYNVCAIFFCSSPANIIQQSFTVAAHTEEPRKFQYKSVGMKNATQVWFSVTDSWQFCLRYKGRTLIVCGLYTYVLGHK